MKKLKYFSLILLLIVISPLCIFLSGCGATPVNDIKAVYFDSNIYDEETGYAVFELDLNTPTTLACKTNPSGWQGTLVFNAINLNPTNAQYFDLDANSGVFTIMNTNYQPVEVQVLIYIQTAGSVESIEDRCIVRQKVYPNAIYLNEDRDTEATLYINSLGAQTLHIFGNFGGGVITELSETDYNFKVESSDISVITVPDSSRLKIRSLKSKIDDVDVTISLLNSKMEVIEGYVLTLHVKVVLPSSSSVATFEGYDDFIFDGDEITINIDDSFDTSIIGGSTYYNLKFEIELFSDQGISSDVYLDPEEYDITCTSNQERYRIIDNDNSIFQIRKPQNSDSLVVEVTIATSAINNSSNVYKMSFTIIFNFVG